MTKRRATHLKATWAAHQYDDQGEVYIEYQTFDVVLPKPHLLRGLGETTLTHLAKSTILHNFLSRQGWRLSVVESVREA